MNIAALYEKLIKKIPKIKIDAYSIYDNCTNPINTWADISIQKLAQEAARTGKAESSQIRNAIIKINMLRGEHLANVMAKIKYYKGRRQDKINFMNKELENKFLAVFLSTLSFWIMLLLTVLGLKEVF